MNRVLPLQNLLEKPLFSSFWMGGFEGACHINRRFERLDLLSSTGHLQHVEDDYRALHQYGITTVRDAVRWPFIETAPGRYDFSSLLSMLAAARRSRMQVIWTLLYYGWPEFIDLFSSEFVRSFVRFAGQVARIIQSEIDQAPWYVVVNEPSYVAYAIGVERTMYPFGPHDGHPVKRQLVRATIEAMEEIWNVDRRARFVHVDPLFNVVWPPDRPDMERGALAQRESQFEFANLVTGRVEPELGGREHYLDVVGLNYYYSNQWEFPLYTQLDWRQEPLDPRWVSLDYLLRMAHARYQRPLVISETGNYREGRGAWIRFIEPDIRKALCEGIPLHGVCIFPIVDRHDWNDVSHWHGSGLWSVDPGTMARSCDPEYHQVLMDYCRHMAPELGSGSLCDIRGSIKSQAA